MKTEFEAKILKIDKGEVREKLRKLGAKVVFPEKKFTRVVFEIRKGFFIRLRDEGDKVTLALKKFVEEKGVSGMQEIEVIVDSFEKTREMLLALGFEETNFQENYREEWEKDGVTFDIDTWPQTEPFLEIEGKNGEEVKKWVEKLGFDFDEAVFGGVDTVYGVESTKLRRLVFDE